MGIESFEGIEKFRDILNYLGYKTIKSIAMLQQQQKFDVFVIAAGNLHSDVQFQKQFTNLETKFGPGDLLVLKEIVTAAIGCMNRYGTIEDEETVKSQIYERCKQVRSNFKTRFIRQNS